MYSHYWMLIVLCGLTTRTIWWMRLSICQWPRIRMSLRLSLSTITKREIINIFVSMNIYSPIMIIMITRTI